MRVGMLVRVKSGRVAPVLLEAATLRNATMASSPTKRGEYYVAVFFFASVSFRQKQVQVFPF